MKKFAVIDCETDPFREGRIPQPFVWGYYHPDDGYEQFDTIEDLIEYIGDEPIRLYAHNGGKFDFHFMLHLIESWEKLIVINGRLAQFKIDNIEFCDSYCILPVPLASYQKTSINYDIFEKEERNKPENKKLISDYLKDDCVFLYELISEFISEHGYSLTIASAAIKKLQKIENIKIPDSGRGFFEEIQPYYYGGRVQCFEKGVIEGDIKYYDINSAYPYAMLHDHPMGDFITRDDREPEIKGHNFYKFQARSTGAFPFRDDDGALTFPDDNELRIFACTGWEVKTATELGLLVDCTHIEQKMFLETQSFKNYVNHFYSIKCTAQKGTPDYIFAKLFLNSAYGKFAANPEKYKTTYLCDILDYNQAISEGYDIHGELHDKLIISKSNDESDWRHYNVATGASITGFVRAYLFQAIQNVDRPLYCDTDSLVFIGNDSIPLGDELGQWDCEGTFTGGGIAGKKVYAFTDGKHHKTACKGVRLGFNDIMKVAEGEKITKTPEVPIFSLKKGKYFLKKTIAQT